MALSNYDKCSLLVPFNEVDESTSATDYSPVKKTLTFADNAKVDTATGYSALKLDGTNDKVTVSAHSDFNFGTGDFLMRFKCKLGSTGIAYGGPINCYPSGNINGKWEIKSRVGSANKFGFTYYNGGSYVDLNVTFNINDDVEHDIEITRVSNNLYMFVDGDLKISNSISSGQIIGPPGYDVNIGYNPTDNTYINGTIRDLEIYKAAGGHTANFTAPSAAQLVKTLSGNVKDDTNANAARVVQAISRQSYNGRPVAFSTTSDGGTGNYSLLVPDIGSEEWTRLFLDNAAGTVYNDLVLGRGTPV